MGAHLSILMFSRVPPCGWQERLSRLSWLRWTSPSLPPTGTGWAYTLHVGANGSRHEFAVTFDVPDTTNALNFADLVTVDPATLIPNAGNPLSDIDQSDIDWAVDAINA